MVIDALRISYYPRSHDVVTCECGKANFREQGGIDSKNDQRARLGYSSQLRSVLSHFRAAHETRTIHLGMR